MLHSREQPRRRRGHFALLTGLAQLAWHPTVTSTPSNSKSVSYLKAWLLRLKPALVCCTHEQAEGVGAPVLVVDGYNVLHTWLTFEQKNPHNQVIPRMPAKLQQFDERRDHFVVELSEFSKWRDLRLLCAFDGKSCRAEGLSPPER